MQLFMDKISIKHFLVHAMPVIIVWGGLGFYMDRASLALVITNLFSATLEFVRDW